MYTPARACLVFLDGAGPVRPGSQFTEKQSASRRAEWGRDRDRCKRSTPAENAAWTRMGFVADSTVRLSIASALLHEGSHTALTRWDLRQE